jgi:outer membrane protein OmpA-like peptidoglycan-associated protein
MRRAAAGPGGEYWAALCVLLSALLLMMLWLGALPVASSQPSAAAVPPEPVEDPIPPAVLQREAELRGLTDAEAARIDEWLFLLSELCHDPELLTRRLRVDCSNGSLFLSEEAFFNADDATLHEEGAANLVAAVDAYLTHLRRSERIWQSIESIEFRGHSDASATGNPYRINLVSSQQRALSALFHLTSESALSETARDDIVRLAVASGAAFSRPPSDCPSKELRCRQYWRRVEIRLELDESELHTRLREYAEEVRRLTPDVE